MKDSLNIRDNETLADALRRTLGREPEFEDFCRAWGGGPLGHSVVEPRSDHLGRPVYKENKNYGRT